MLIQWKIKTTSIAIERNLRGFHWFCCFFLQASCFTFVDCQLCPTDIPQMNHIRMNSNLSYSIYQKLFNVRRKYVAHCNGIDGTYFSSWRLFQYNSFQKLMETQSMFNAEKARTGLFKEICFTAEASVDLWHTSSKDRILGSTGAYKTREQYEIYVVSVKLS